MSRGMQTHVAFYVKNLDESVAQWKKLLAILDPDVVEREPAYQEAGEGLDLTRVATFVNPNGLEFQFVWSQRYQDDPNTVDRIDHIHFATVDVEDKFEQIRDAGFRVNAYTLTDAEPTDSVISSEGLITMYDRQGNTAPMDWQKWFLVPMPGNVAVEVARPYQAVNGIWEPIENFSRDERYGVNG